ncbi:hypothetical protein B0A49_08239 [Cryomyces minteri]|uniref:Uncharacterized protein n=1 Tax=Cryomyces minteri TaxID=331657 RepID=A0A4V5NFI2_9PEZI|nr:hypothetical protein B0A49_08239 [Cryomyces minteri]
MAGGEIIHTDFPCAGERIPADGKWDWMYGEPSEREFTVAKVDAYNNINSYLAELQGTTMKTAEDIVAYADANSGTEGARAGDHAAFASGQDLFNEVVPYRGVKDGSYRKALSYTRRKSRDEGIDAALHVTKDGRSIELDALLLCDGRGAGQQIAAQAGMESSLKISAGR